MTKFQPENSNTQILICLPLLANIILLVYLWRTILRTQRTLREAEKHLKELSKKETLLNAMYTDDIQVIMPDTPFSRPKRKRLRFLLGMN